eukprot:5375661-Prymnesium_polylepis.1
MAEGGFMRRLLELGQLAAIVRERARESEIRARESERESSEREGREWACERDAAGRASDKEARPVGEG